MQPSSLFSTGLLHRPQYQPPHYLWVPPRRQVKYPINFLLDAWLRLGTVQHQLLLYPLTKIQLHHQLLVPFPRPLTIIPAVYLQLLSAIGQQAHIIRITLVPENVSVPLPLYLQRVRVDTSTLTQILRFYPLITEVQSWIPFAKIVFKL